MNFFDELKIRYQNLSFRRKLFFSYVVLVILPLLFLSLFFNLRMQRQDEEKIRIISENHLFQTCEVLTGTLSEMEKLARSLSAYPGLQAALDSGESLSLYEQYNFVRLFSEASQNTLYSNTDYSPILFVRDDLAMSHRKSTVYPFSEYYRITGTSPEAPVTGTTFCGPFTVSSYFNLEEDYFAVIYPVYSLSDFRKVTAFSAIYITTARLAELLLTADYSGEGNVYLTDAEGTVLLAVNSNTASIFTPDPGLAFDPEEISASRGISGILTGNYRIVAEPDTDLSSGFRSVLKANVAVAGVVGLLLLLVSYRNSANNSRRIIELSRAFSEIRRGKLDSFITVDCGDEIGELQMSYNEMLQRLQKMLENEFDLGNRLRESDLKLLQAQIDPHFLYNTLNLLSWTVQNKDPDEACEIIRVLSDYYRISLSRGADIIPLDRELRHVRLYVFLQNKRFDGRIRLTVDIGDLDPEQYRIPKVVLQPLVENCIKHGLAEEPVHILIRLRKLQDMLEIRVTDDGTGMTVKDLERLRASLSGPALSLNTGNDQELSGGGYGIANITDRLRNYFKDRATVDFQRNEPRGFTVILRIPAAVEEQDKNSAI